MVRGEYKGGHRGSLACLLQGHEETAPSGRRVFRLCGRSHKDLVGYFLSQAQSPSIHTDASAAEELHLDSRVYSQRRHTRAKAPLSFNTCHPDLFTCLCLTQGHPVAACLTFFLATIAWSGIIFNPG